MAIHTPERFNQARPAGFDGLFDWDFLKPAFAPTKIQPMDWDGVVERGGHFLTFETKAPGQEVPLGQRITLETAVMTGFHTVFLIKGKTQLDIQGLEVWTLNHDEGVIRRTDFGCCTAETVVEMTRAWFDYASGYPHPLIKRARAAARA
jgi:hypothetical protein